MATHAYDDLYSYLAAFKNSSLAEIIAYLEELGQRRFDAFIRGLAPLKEANSPALTMPVESKTFTIWQSSQHCMQIKH